MQLVTTKEMFKNASESSYTIGAFNVNNMENVQGITPIITFETDDEAIDITTVIEK